MYLRYLFCFKNAATFHGVCGNYVDGEGGSQTSFEGKGLTWNVRKFHISSTTILGPVVQVISEALSEQKVAGSISTISDFHTVAPC